ncbi:hypothetical protein [Parabacteroides distasonis]
MSKTLEYAYTEWCMSQLAKRSAKKDNHFYPIRYKSNGWSCET